MNTTFAIIKPHILDDEIEDEVLSYILSNKFVILRLETRYLTDKEIAQLYDEHKGKYFYDGLCQRMREGPCMIMELTVNPYYRASLEESWQQWREFIGSTDPNDAKDNTIRKLYGVSNQYNAVHGSDSKESAIRELGIFFKH